MKNLKIIAIITAVLFFVGCSKDFLETSPTAFLSSDDFSETGQKNPDVLDATLNGLYSTMINTGTGGTTAHYDFGQKSYDIFSDMLSSDMALSVNTYNWFFIFTDYRATTDYTRRENYIPWRYYYRVIRSANLIIQGLGGNDVTPNSDEGKYTMGQAKAMRAYAYFYLAQFYISEYTAGSKVLPIYIDPTQPNQVQSATEEVYNLIISDLTDAISLLNGFSRSAKNAVNIDVAKGLLAYTYGAIGTADANAKAKALADEVINSGNYTLMSSDEVTGGFNDINTSGWMWGADLTTDMGFGLLSWWGEMDIYTYSYAWAGDVKAIDQDLYNTIPESDVRKVQFLNYPGHTYNLTPYKKFYDPGRSIGGQRVVVTDYVFMRIAEMYLLAAEMAAKTGDEATAKARLKSLVSQRLDDASYIDELSGQALLDEIYLQTRIELWGEGKSYLAMKRNKATIKRGANHLSYVGVEVKYNDNRLTWEIPAEEIRDNPLISN